MNIHKGRFGPLEFNFESWLQPLFDAMQKGKTIKSITCMKGTMNKDHPELDFQIEEFIATNYWVAIGANAKINVDLVDTNKRSFYMNWVRSFEL